MLKTLYTPRFNNELAWKQRWHNRGKSVSLAQRVLDLERAGRSVSVLERGLAFRTLGWQAKWRGDLDQAQVLCEHALEDLKSAGALSAQADIYSVLGIIHLTRMQVDAAQSAVERGFIALTQEWRSETAVDLLSTEASIKAFRGRMEAAGDCLQTAHEHATGIHVSRLAQNRARYFLWNGDYARAREEAAKGVLACGKFGNRLVLPYLHEVLGAAIAKQGLAEVGRAVIEDGLRLATEDLDLRAQCQLIEVMGRIDCEGGAHERGMGLLEAAAQRSAEINAPLNRHSVYQALASALKDRGDLEAAVKAQQEARLLAYPTRR